MSETKEDPFFNTILTLSAVALAIMVALPLVYIALVRNQVREGLTVFQFPRTKSLLVWVFSFSFAILCSQILPQFSFWPDHTLLTGAKLKGFVFINFGSLLILMLTKKYWARFFREQDLNAHKHLF